MPMEVNATEENIVIRTIDAIPMLNNFCYFEIGYVLKSVLFQALFNLTLNISRLIDVEPIAEFKKKLMLAQKKLTNTILPLEMIVRRRENDDDYKEYVQKKFEEA